MQNKIHVKYCSLLYLLDRMIHCVKSVKYVVFSGPYFPVFWLSTEIYSVNLRIQSEYRKIQTRKKLRIWTLFTQWLGIIRIDEKDFFLHIVHFPWCCLGKFLPARIFFSHRNQEATTIKISLALVICTFMLVVFISFLMTFEDFRSSNHYISFFISAAF